MAHPGRCAVIAAPLPAVHRLDERTEAGGLFRDYVNDSGQTVTVKAGPPVLPEPDTAAEAARAFAPACPCPDHPAAVLQPLPGGGARGTCPVDSRSYQMSPLEVTA